MDIQFNRLSVSLTSRPGSGNCVKSANGEFPDSSCASRLACAVICGDTRGGTFQFNTTKWAYAITLNLI